MPVIKSAKKRMRQNVVRRARNFPVRSELKTMVKKVLTLVKEGNLEEAAKLMPGTYAIIDKAAKKNILHPNNAARKKSRLARALNDLQQNGPKSAKPVTKKTKEKAKKEVVKKEVKEVVKEEKAETAE